MISVVRRCSCAVLVLVCVALVPSCQTGGLKRSPATAPSTQPDPTATLRDPIKIQLGKVREPLPYRIVSFHKGKADKRLIRLASELGFNGVQIQIEGSNVEGVKAFAKYDAKEHLIDYCHSLGMKVTVWVHEFSDVPMPWMPEYLGEMTTQNQALWKLLEDRYDWMLSEPLAKADGLVLTVVETHIRATDSSTFVKLAKMLREKCDQYQKSLIVRTFVWYPKEFASVMAGLDQLPKDQVIMSKCVPQDWNIRGTDAPEIGAVGGRPQIEEWDVAGEYFLRNNVANCMPGILKRQFDYGVARGIQGVCVRVDRDDDNVLHEPNEVNLWTLGLLAGGASDNLDEIWHAWATNRFGKAAAPGVVRALKPAGPVVEEILSIGTHSFGDTRRFPPLGDDDFLGQLHQNWWWDERYSGEHFKAEIGDEGYIQQVAAAKASASAAARMCLTDLDLVKDQLKPEDYAILHTRLLSNRALIDVRGPMAVADLRYRQWINATSDADRAKSESAWQTDLGRVRQAALPVYEPATKLAWLGKTWWVGAPDAVYRDSVYDWAWKMDMLRRGEDPRPVMLGHGLEKYGRRPTTQPATAPSGGEVAPY